MKIEAQNVSALHRWVRDLLRKVYPQYTIYENYPVECPINGRRTLFVDLFVKELKLAVECHGRQHFEYVEHFHGNRGGFAASQGRDRAKMQVLHDAGITCIIVRYDEERKLTRVKLLRRVLKAIQENS